MGKTRLQLRTDLLTDLKMTDEISAAEMNRAIEKAVADLSRFLPRQRIYEESLQFTIDDESVTMPKDTSTDGVVADEDISASSAADTAAIDGQPDVPRPLTVTLTDADDSVTGLTIIIKGTNEDDEATGEVFHYIKGDSKTIPGTMYFKNVYSVEIDQIAGNAASDVLDVGWGAYTDVWVSMANKPIKWGSEDSVTDGDGNTIVRDTDFYIDYQNGRIQAISGGDIVAEDTVTISYTKNRTHIDLSDLTDLIRVERVEYPVGDIPQSFCQWDIWAGLLSITGMGEMQSQSSLAEDKIVRVYYSAQHQEPAEYSPGTIPPFLENTVLLVAGAYSLYMYVIKLNMQAEADLDSARTSLAAAATAHTALDTALTNVKKYLDNNTDADAAGILQDITDEVANLRTAIATALDAAQAYLAEVDTTDLQGAEGVWDDYANTTNYLTGGAEPDVLQYLTTGDALLNTLSVGGEQQSVPEAYALYAKMVRENIIGPFEVKRKDFISQGNVRTNAALGFVQEAVQRLANLRTYIDQSAGYATISNTFARKVEAHLSKISAKLSEAAGFMESSKSGLEIASKIRQDAEDRRNEAWAIWRDRGQYIGDVASSSVRQPAGGR